MAKLKVSIIDPHTLRLEEDGKIGDTIDLKSLHSVDESTIIERIKIKQDETYNRLLEGVIRDNQSQIQLKLNEQLRMFEQDKNKLLQEKRELELKMNNQLELSKKNEESIAQKLKSEFELERQRLNNELNMIERETKQILESEFKEQLSIKNTQITALQTTQEKLEMSHKLQMNEALKKLEDEISKK